MGQYFEVVNVDKREYFHPLDIGDGCKLGELAHGLSATVLALLIASPHNGYERPYPFAGRWAGDRVVVLGDSAGAFLEFDSGDDSKRPRALGYTDISGVIRAGVAHSYTWRDEQCRWHREPVRKMGKES